MKQKKEYILKNTTAEITALTPIDLAKVNVPEITEITVKGTKAITTIKAGERPISEFAVDFETKSPELNAELKKLEACQAGIMRSKLYAGLALERIARKPEKGEPLYKEVASTFEEFCTMIHMNKKTAYLWRGVANYASVDGKLLNCITNGMVAESAIFAAYSLHWSSKTLDDICSTADHAIKSAKDLFREYNRYIKSLDTDEELQTVDEETGKPSGETAESADAETTAETETLDGIKCHLFSVSGIGIKKNTTIKIPESAMQNEHDLYKYAIENRLAIAEKVGINVKKDNNAAVLFAKFTEETKTIVIAQTIPEIKVITIMSIKSLSGHGIREKTEPETEPETENENGNT